MSRSDAFLPFRVPPQGVFEYVGDGWTVLIADRQPRLLRDGEPFPEWDAHLDFYLERRLSVTSAFSAALGCGHDHSAFEVLVVLSTAGGLRRRVIWREPLPIGAPCELSVRLHPDSGHLARDLSLTTTVCLRREVPTEDPLAPKSTGQSIWASTESFRLEGGAARLAMYEVQFEQSWPGRGIGNAEFHVEVRDDPTLDIEAAVTVYLNTERPEFLRAVARGDEGALAKLWSGVISRVLLMGCLGDWLPDGTPCSPGSLGATLRQWSTQALGIDSMAALGDYIRGEASMFGARIDSWVMNVMSHSGGSRA